MPGESKTVVVTGASQGIGAGVVAAFLENGYRVVANSRSIARSGPFTPSDKLALVDGDISEAATAERIAETKDSPQDFLKTLSPMGRVSGVRDITDAVLYLTEASLVTGEVLHVDGGAHFGKW